MGNLYGEVVLGALTHPAFALRDVGFRDEELMGELDFVLERIQLSL